MKGKIKLLEPLKSPKQQPESSAVTNSISEDDYNGILPVDEGRFSEGVDRELVKKIVLIIGMMLLM